VRPIILAAILVGGLAASACTADQHVDFFEPVAKDPNFPGTPGDPATYQNLLSYTPNPACAPNVPRALNRRTELRIFRGNGITMDDVVRFVGGLKRYYDYYGVTMFTRYTVFIGVHLTDFVLPEPDIVIAHEVGHAYGLEHLEPSAYGANLMNPTATVCDLPLNLTQLSAIEQATAKYGTVLDPAKYHGPELLSFINRAPEIMDIMRGRIAKLARAQEVRP
jgi:hypothetical protein